MSAFLQKTPAGLATSGFINPVSVADTMEITEGMHIADFGCGAGYFSIVLAKRVGESGRVYALDIQEAPLEVVAQKAHAEGLGNIETMRVNLEVAGGSRLENNSLDLVLVKNVLYQSKQKTEIIREAKRVLKGGGRLFVVDWEKGAGGVGPPDDLRTSMGDIAAMVEDVGFSSHGRIPVGGFHYGLMFRKPE